MMDRKNFDDGHRFDELGEFLDKHEFCIEDMLAVICAHLYGYKKKVFETEMFVGGCEFKIKIDKKEGVYARRN